MSCVLSTYCCDHRYSDDQDHDPPAPAPAPPPPPPLPLAAEEAGGEQQPALISAAVEAVRTPSQPLNALLAGAFDFGIQQRLEVISAKYKLNIDPTTVKTRKRYQSKLIKLLADNPALQAKARLYEGVTFYS
jgi:hypothetical protein